MRERGAIILGDKRGYRRPRRIVKRRASVVAFGVLAFSYVLWAMNTTTEHTRIKQALVDISRIEHATRLFRTDQGRCPDNMEELVFPPGDRRYLAPQKDPWGQPYKLRCPARRDPGGAEVFSGGPDQSFAGEDNISSL